MYIYVYVYVLKQSAQTGLRVEVQLEVGYMSKKKVHPIFFWISRHLSFWIDDMHGHLYSSPLILILINKYISQMINSKLQSWAPRLVTAQALSIDRFLM